MLSAIRNSLGLMSHRSISASAKPSLLITPEALADKLAKTPERVKILDATWFMPNLVPPRDPHKEFLTGPRIKGVTGFWDVDDVADKSHPLGLKHMMPSPDRFAEACSALGIDADSEVIVYDTHSIFSSPRTVFTFKAFNHEKAYVLDGGLPRWQAEQRPVEGGEFSAQVKPTAYPVPSLNAAMLRSYEQISDNAAKKADAADIELVLDARPKGRFAGTDPEPRAGLSSGHMPHSVSLPLPSLLTPESSSSPPYKVLLSTTEIRAVILKALGGDEARLQDLLDGKTRIINSCGSGMTAAGLWLALQELGVDSAIYDESWTGYSMRKESVILKH